jgi:hypothetical protein
LFERIFRKALGLVVSNGPWFVGIPGGAKFLDLDDIDTYVAIIDSLTPSLTDTRISDKIKPFVKYSILVTYVPRTLDSAWMLVRPEAHPRVDLARLAKMYFCDQMAFARDHARSNIDKLFDESPIWRICFGCQSMDVILGPATWRYWMDHDVVRRMMQAVRPVEDLTDDSPLVISSDGDADDDVSDDEGESDSAM